VQTPFSVLGALPSPGEEITLRTHCVVREDAHLLFGFLHKEECQLFQEIIKISGVGPKIALAILSGLSCEEFCQVVSSQAPLRLRGLPGVGAKTAQRIITEMADRLPKLGFSHVSLPASVFQKGVVDEAIAALIALGYKPQEAAKAVEKVKDKTQHCEHIIKEALQGAARL